NSNNANNTNNLNNVTDEICDDTLDNDNDGDIDCDDADCAEATNCNVNNTNNANYDEGDVAACTGNIHYQMWLHEAPTALLVFVNGRAEYTDKYHHLIPLFARSWDILMIDHYGQGRSEGVRAHANDFDSGQVCDLKTVIESLIRGEMPVAVIGHSMGGFISTRLAQLHPEVVDVLVASSPMYGIPTGDITLALAKATAAQKVSAGLGEVPYAIDEDGPTPFESNILTHDQTLYEQFYTDPLTEIGEPTWGWLNAAFIGFDRLFAAPEDIVVPFMMMVAGDEQMVLPGSQDDFCSAMNAATADSCLRVSFENDYHELFNELDRETVVETALTFIDANL
ncbi:lysophospholipase, partial [Myxococcota bacterium]|nr:lysophospholipase [Myxococcota bacterium]MBU1510571.1 lysophospholipase [Myxococcota bacterium]